MSSVIAAERIYYINIKLTNTLFCAQNLGGTFRIIITISIVVMIASAYLEMTISRHCSKSFNESANLICTITLPQEETLQFFLQCRFKQLRRWLNNLLKPTQLVLGELGST